MNKELLNSPTFTIWVLPNGQNVEISDCHFGISAEPTLKGTLDFMAKHPEDRFLVNLNIRHDGYTIRICFDYPSELHMPKNESLIGVKKIGEEKIVWNTDEESKQLFKKLKVMELTEYVFGLFKGIKNNQTAIKVLQSEIKIQKVYGMSPNQSGEGFKETLERYKDMNSSSQSRKSTEYAKKIGICDFNFGYDEMGGFTTFGLADSFPIALFENFLE